MSTVAPQTIVLVDDDEAKRYTIAKILRRGGYEVREAATGAEAIRLCAEQPDLAILDVKLPDISGFEVCRRIKNDAATARIPVLHISSTFVEIEDKVQGLESGADGYLTDVAEPLELLATVRALLRARKAEDAAQLTVRQWQTTFDAINDGVFLLDGEGKLVQVNRAFEGILNTSWNDLIGLDAHVVIGLSPDPAESPFHRIHESHQRESRDLTRGNRWLQLTVDPIQDPAGTVRGALGIISDISQRKQMEEQLRQQARELLEADRSKDEFLAMLAHELRNPLAPILNSLEAIRLDRTDAESVLQSVDTAGRQVRHMARLLDDLLDVSRFTRGKIQLRCALVDLKAIIGDAVETSRPLLASLNHTLSVSVPPEPLPLHGDPTRLEQVISNLLNNAAKYTEPGGRIGLTATREHDELVVRVRDTGIGIAPEMLPRVFDLFIQAERSLDRSQGGLGIGLTLVRTLVEMHGGRVEAASAGLRRGSEFTVRLPAMSSAAPPDLQPTSPRAAAAPASAGLDVLVVDDHRDSAQSLAKVLRLWGHRVRVVHDGPSAIEATQEHKPDVVLLDIGLPGMDGYQVSERLRALVPGQNMTLVALTGYGQEQDVRRSQNSGFDHHMVKPVSFDELERLLGTQVASSSTP